MSDSATVELRNLVLDDYPQLAEAMREAYSGWADSVWEETSIARLLKLFPEGQLCVLMDGKVVGCALSLIVNYRRFGDNHTFDQITGRDAKGTYTFATHDAEGDVLYGIEVFVHPEHRGLRLGRRLYEARKELCESLNLRSIVIGGRIPNYGDHADDMTPKDYIIAVRERRMHDPVLNFQLSNDFHVRKVLKGYLPGDESSLEYATLMEWNNIYYQPDEAPLKGAKSVVRLGLIQWQMRQLAGFEAWLEQVEFFVDAVSDYQSDFVLFPEFFNAALMAPYNHLSEAEAIRALAKYTPRIRDALVEMAISYNVNIVGGSMPFIDENERLLNVGYLCRRDGTTERYEKLHITPSETSAWGMVGGDQIACFDTDCGKIGIVVCYDVEFPELPRLLAEEGMQILFVPFLTDTQNGYTRVRRCSQARAIENECYVAIAGCVGNLPKVNNMDIQYGQAAVFTPSDFAFPSDGVKAAATPNTEATLLADVDLDSLKELHNHGSVQTLKDRRDDLYRIVRV